jgi:hypothetical protein
MAAKAPAAADASKLKPLGAAGRRSGGRQDSEDGARRRGGAGQNGKHPKLTAPVRNEPAREEPPQAPLAYVDDPTTGPIPPSEPPSSPPAGYLCASFLRFSSSAAHRPQRRSLRPTNPRPSLPSAPYPLIKVKVKVGAKLNRYRFALQCRAEGCPLCKQVVILDF